MVSKQPKTAIKKGRYDFDDSELATLATRLTESIDKHDDLKEQQKSSAKEYSKQIEEVNLEIRNLSKLHKQQHEYRDYLCDIEYDYLHSIKRFVRQDTGEVIDSEPISEREWEDYRQLKLDLERQAAEADEQDTDDDTGLPADQLPDVEDDEPANNIAGQILAESSPFAVDNSLQTVGRGKRRVV